MARTSLMGYRFSVICLNPDLLNRISLADERSGLGLSTRLRRTTDRLLTLSRALYVLVLTELTVTNLLMIE